ncbi:MAG: hypothetical protein AAFV96_02690 [Pseudomonadota bacterium]
MDLYKTDPRNITPATYAEAERQAHIERSNAIRAAFQVLFTWRRRTEMFPAE